MLISRVPSSASAPPSSWIGQPAGFRACRTGRRPGAGSGTCPPASSSTTTSPGPSPMPTSSRSAGPRGRHVDLRADRRPGLDGRPPPASGLAVRPRGDRRRLVPAAARHGPRLGGPSTRTPQGPPARPCRALDLRHRPLPHRALVLRGGEPARTRPRAAGARVVSRPRRCRPRPRRLPRRPLRVGQGRRASARDGCASPCPPATRRLHRGPVATTRPTSASGSSPARPGRDGTHLRPATGCGDLRTCARWRRSPRTASTGTAPTGRPRHVGTRCDPYTNRL